MMSSHRQTHRLSANALAREQTRRAEIAHYFRSAPLRIEDNPAIRTPQREAYHAFRAQAAWSVNIAKLVELPTACGKTGVIAMAPFGIAQGRVLIITPNVTIREEITAKLDGQNPSNIYDTLQILPPGHPLPQVIELSRNGAPNLDDCRRADIVVANIHQALLYRHAFPESFFDLLIVDEGHHIPADSWQQIITHFRFAKKLYLTATPFRADGQPIDGDPIYRYRLADAIAQGYVKNLIRIDAVPNRLIFVAGDTRTEYSMHDVLNMKTEEWFSRGIALSQACNETILEKAVQLLNEKRRRSWVPHQIIAAACSRRHAQQLVALCRRRGLRTTCLLSTMPIQEQHAIKEAIKANRFDCVVHVGMLGEGYDHPPFSIAAIFRPYRSRAPYEQFIGRTLRCIPHAAPHDNIAHIVSHVGLNLDHLWQAFRDELRDPSTYRSAPDPLRPEPQPHEDEEIDDTDDDRTIEIPRAAREEVREFTVDTFVPLAASTASSHHSSHTPPAPPSDHFNPVPTLPSGRPWPPPSLPSRPTTPIPINRPDRLRRHIKTQLAKDCRRTAGKLLHALGLTPDHTIVPILGKGGEKNNFEVLIRFVNRELNRAMGKEASQSHRDHWTLDELTTAQARLETLFPTLLEICRRALDPARRDGHPPAPSIPPTR
jgi:superfamily II DNA or RNA helicase